MRKFINITSRLQILEDFSDDMIDSSATPPEYEDQDAHHFDALRKTGFFGQQGAGALMISKTTGRFLIGLRSAKVREPHTWNLFGGAIAVDDNGRAKERPIEAAKREAHEETGYTGSIQMVPLYVFSKGDFRYSNFLAIVEDEFTPHLGWEADRAVWVKYGHWPKPLHFGLNALFGDPKSDSVIKHYASMFASAKHSVTEDITGYDYSSIRKMTDRPEPIGSSDNASPDEIENIRMDARASVDAKRAKRREQSIEEDINLPAGVDVAKAIGDAQDSVKALSNDGNGDSDDTGNQNTQSNGQQNNQNNNNQNGQNQQNQNNGQNNNQSNAQNQNSTNNGQQPNQNNNQSNQNNNQNNNAPKSLAPIRPQ